MSDLQGVGFWIDFEVLEYSENARQEYAYDLALPDPRILLEKLGPCQPDERISGYLRSGLALASFMGCSYCRFGCGSPEEEMGCCDLTDGVWVWPEGLVHYIEVHQVPLPGAFIATMEQNQWHVPEVANIDELFELGYSLEFWENWYKYKTVK